MSQITETIRASAPGDGVPVDALWQAAYTDLKRLAHARLRESGPHTLMDTTALVHDSWLKLSASAGTLDVRDRAHFLAYAARVMRSVIVDAVRARCRDRRGGDAIRITLDTGIEDLVPAEQDPLCIDEALVRLAEVEPRLAQVVEMRYFGGLQETEVGEALGLTERTVRRDWNKARVMLRAMLVD